MSFYICCDNNYLTCFIRYRNFIHALFSSTQKANVWFRYTVPVYGRPICYAWGAGMTTTTTRECRIPTVIEWIFRNSVTTGIELHVLLINWLHRCAWDRHSDLHLHHRIELNGAQDYYWWRSLRESEVVSGKIVRVNKCFLCEPHAVVFTRLYWELCL